jgi:reprolysin-like metallo-peptidase family M12B
MRLTPLLLLALVTPAAAQDDARRAWTRTSDPAVVLDVDALRAHLRSAPREGAPGPALVLALPLPRGRFERFAVVEAPVLEAPLAARFPELRTYRAQGLDDRTATARLDLTPLGFHALVVSARGTTAIDPQTPGDATRYRVLTKGGAPRAPFRCLVDDAAPPPPDALALPHGDTLRTFRLALAVTGEYTATVCAPSPPGVACGLAAIVTGVNRLTGIYERELAVRFVLVANENLLIYTDGATDPYTNGVPASMREENQANVTAVIGTPNFDLGHVFGTGGGGIATIPGICLAAHKARGATGLADPTGDPFYVDYVSHELGHQMGANHSFNGTSGSCGPSRNASTAWETGSGSTIMSYSGLCAAENVQTFSDDVFHVGSLTEISNNLAGGGSCFAATATGNTIPTVSAGPDLTVPAGTPFTLTATGSDPDGDALTYSWEEMDLGNAGPPNTDDGTRPIFRAYAPTTSPSRTFPRLQFVLDDDNTPPATPVSESLPTTTRPLQFRATVRDNRAGGGGVATDLAVVSVTSAAGPFKVTVPDTALVWIIGSPEPVSWNVANTTAAPVSCSTVDVLLSRDGGATFPVVLASATPNDGSETVTVPAPPTTGARIRVECATAPFFDVSNVSFEIRFLPVELQGFSIE